MENITEEHICNAVGCNAIAIHKCKCSIVIQDTNEKVIENVWFCHDCYMRQKAIQYEHERVI
jgi:hypothetical protein